MSAAERVAVSLHGADKSASKSQPIAWRLFGAAQAATYTYTSATTGATTQWAAGTNWDAVPMSASTTTLDFGEGHGTRCQCRADQQQQQHRGDFQLNALNYTYAGPASGTVPAATISENPLQLISNGGTTPVLTLNFTGTVKPTLTISSNMVLTNALTVAGTTPGTFSGVIQRRRQSDKEQRRKPDFDGCEHIHRRHDDQ